MATIHCREEKNARRLFTRWHEVANLLVLTPRLSPPFNRDPKERCPVERLMDVVVGEIGFYEPIFRPAFEKCVLRHGGLSYQTVEGLRATYCPAASSYATAIAADRRSCSRCQSPEGLTGTALSALKGPETQPVLSGCGTVVRFSLAVRGLPPWPSTASSNSVGSRDRMGCSLLTTVLNSPTRSLGAKQADVHLDGEATIKATA